MNIRASSRAWALTTASTPRARSCSHCEFDAAACSEGLKALRSYRKEWDEERGIWRDKPRHDWASHGADAFRCLASRYKQFEMPPPKAHRKRLQSCTAALAGKSPIRRASQFSNGRISGPRNARQKMGTFFRTDCD